MTCGLPPVTGLVALISSPPLLPLGCNNGELMLGVGANTRDMSTINARLIRVEGVIHAWLVSHSITALRLALGAVFLGFGVLKYFPGVSPAAGLAEATIQQMTAGLIREAWRWWPPRHWSASSVCCCWSDAGCA